MSRFSHALRAVRRSRWAWLALLAPAALLAHALSAAPRPPPLGEGEPETRARIAQSVRRMEPHWRRHSLQRFPADPWSQSDEFASRERLYVRRQSRVHGIRPGAILKAIDADIRAHPTLEGVHPEARGAAFPCMPRVFYH